MFIQQDQNEITGEKLNITGILDSAKIYKENLGRFKNSELLKKLLDAFDKAFNSSLGVIDKLEESENGVINGFIHELERNGGQYLPLTEKESL